MARSTVTAKPRASAKLSRQQLHSLVAFWSLRLLTEVGYWKQLTGYPDALTYDGQLLRTLGLGQYEDDDIRPQAFLRLLKERLRVLGSKQPEAVLEPVHQRLHKELALSPVECRILTLVLTLVSSPSFVSLTGEFGELTGAEVIASIARLLDIPRPAVRQALSPDGHLARSGLLRVSTGGVDTLADKFRPLDGLDALLFESHTSVDSLTRRYFTLAPAPTLTRQDYAHLGETLTDLLAYLKAARQRHEPGCNVLLYGVPGVGKTEFAGVLAQALKLRLYAISTSDEDGDAISDSRRVGAYQLAQQTLSRQPTSLILFDEVEDLLAPSLFSSLFEGDPPTANKGFTNQLLASNPIPALWIANDISEVDPAYLRRFDLVIEMPVPPQAVRTGIAAKAFADLGVSESFVQGVARQSRLAPAHLTRAARVARLCASGKSAGAQREALLTRLLGGTLKALGHPNPLVIARPALTAYQLELLNPDRPLEPILRGLAELREGRLCLAGPPGTGKSAFGAEVARQLEQPLLVKRASDLLGSLVGQTEQAIRDMFAEARAEKAILLLDEADSFLRSREGARQSWEVMQVNELLTQMEAFEGIFIATTNRLEQFDPASLRRFDLKLTFQPLRPEQRVELFTQVLRERGVASRSVSCWRQRLAGLDGLTPGDFAAVIRQLRIEQAEWTPERLFERLQGECRHKRQGHHPIGFAAAF